MEKTEEMPEELNIGLLCPIFKKGSKEICSNYRGITLLSVLYKHLSNPIMKRLNVFTEKTLGEYQCGFRYGRGTIDQIFFVRQTMELIYEYNMDLHLLFIDYKQAFDSVNRTSLFGILKEYGIPAKHQTNKNDVKKYYGQSHDWKQSRKCL